MDTIPGGFSGKNGKSRQDIDNNSLSSISNGIQPPKNSRNDSMSGENLQILRNFDDPLDPVPTRPKLTRDELLSGAPLAKDPIDIKDPRFKSPDDFLKKIAPKKKALQPPLVVEPQTPPPAPDPIAIAPAPLKEIQPMGDDFQAHFGMLDLSQIRKELQAEREEKAKQQEVTVENPAPKKGPNIKIDQAAFSSIFATAKIAQDKPVAVTHAPAPLEDSTKISKELFQWKEYSQQVKLWQAQVMGIVQNLKAELKKTQNSQDEIAKLKEQLKQKDEQISKLQKKSAGKLLGWMKGFGRVH